MGSGPERPPRGGPLLAAGLAPWTALKGVTPRLAFITSAVVLLCVAAAGTLATWRHYSHTLDELRRDLGRLSDVVAPLLVHERFGGSPPRSGAPLRRAVERLDADLAIVYPELAAFTVEESAGARPLFSSGIALPPLADADRARAGDGGLDQVLAVPEGTLVVRSARLFPGRGSRSALGLMRVAMRAPSFREFLLDRVRRDAWWILATFLVATLASSTLIGQMTRSLRSVASYARAIERGEFHREIDIKGRDEASAIADAFNVVLHQLKQSYISTLGALAALLETKDRSTESHSLRGVRYALELARGIGLSRQELIDLEYGALLHDIGKIGVADIILKKSGPLTEEEWQVMRQHPTIGYNVLKNIEFLHNSLPVVLHHQERWDGRGYPNGLKGEQIPLLARIFTIADSFDAMTSDRPYRRSMRPEMAIHEIKRNAGAQFDPRLVEVFVGLWADGRLSRVDAEMATEGLRA